MEQLTKLYLLAYRPKGVNDWYPSMNFRTTRAEAEADTKVIPVIVGLEYDCGIVEVMLPMERKDEESNDS